VGLSNELRSRGRIRGSREHCHILSPLAKKRVSKGLFDHTPFWLLPIIWGIRHLKPAAAQRWSTISPRNFPCLRIQWCHWSDGIWLTPCRSLVVDKRPNNPTTQDRTGLGESITISKLRNILKSVWCLPSAMHQTELQMSQTLLNWMNGEATMPPSDTSSSVSPKTRKVP
jgi:hypothetical protein